jgi:hypothetical protein
MKIKRRQLILAVTGSVLIALGGGLYLWRTHGERALAAYKKQLIAAGEKLTVEELLPRPVPPEENSAGVFHQATSSRRGRSGLLDTNPPAAMRMVAFGKAMIGSAQPEVLNYGTNSWEELDAALAQNQAALELLDQIIDRPVLDFQLNYELGGFPSFAYLSELKGAVQLLSAATIWDVHRGEAQSAGRRVQAMLALVKGDQEERFVISQLVRIAMAHIAIPATWELLQSPGLTETQLAELQRDWVKQEFLKPAEAALAMERVHSLEIFRQMRSSSAAFRQYASGGMVPAAGSAGPWYQQVKEAALLKTKESLWRVAWSYPDQIRGLKGAQALLDAIRMAARDRYFAEAFRQQEKRLAELGIKARKEDEEGWLVKLGDLDLMSLSESSVLSLRRFLYREFNMEAARHLVVTAIALKRYQLQHGNYPVKLADLVPDFVPELPRDPMDGQPLRYKLKEDGTFLLYSIGEDGLDDGGDPSSKANANATSFSWQRGRDLVWPQPAKPEEVKAYWERQKPPGRALADVVAAAKRSETNRAATNSPR